MSDQNDTGRVVQWLCFSTDPARDRLSNEMAGRRLHAVFAADTETGSDIASRPAACGHTPRHGYEMDAFNTERCKRCLAALAREDGAP